MILRCRTCTRTQRLVAKMTADAEIVVDEEIAADVAVAADLAVVEIAADVAEEISAEGADLVAAAEEATLMAATVIRSAEMIPQKEEATVQEKVMVKISLPLNTLTVMQWRRAMTAEKEAAVHTVSLADMEAVQDVKAARRAAHMLVQVFILRHHGIVL